MINAAELTGKSFSNLKIVINGAGAAGIACYKLILLYGAKKVNCIMLDTKGVIYKGRTENMNKYKNEAASDTLKRTLDEALINADVFIGVSVKGTLSKENIMKMNKDPIIFALANPDPEIDP